MDTNINAEAMNNQIIYKLATIEAQVAGLSDNLISAVRRIEDRVTTTAQESAAMVARVDLRAEKLEERLEGLEAWKSQITTKIGFLVSAVSLFWLVFGKGLEDTVSNIF